MNQEIKAKWLDALRSGEYKQGDSRLRVGDTFCCLGVLCDLHAKAGLGKWVTDKDRGLVVIYQPLSGNQRSNLLPPEVVKWAQLVDEPDYVDGSVDPVVNNRRLSKWNDGSARRGGPAMHDRLSFPQIADMIEQYL